MGERRFLRLRDSYFLLEAVTGVNEGMGTKCSTPHSRYLSRHCCPGEALDTSSLPNISFEFSSQAFKKNIPLFIFKPYYPTNTICIPPYNFSLIFFEVLVGNSYEINGKNNTFQIKISKY